MHMVSLLHMFLLSTGLKFKQRPQMPIDLRIDEKVHVYYSYSRAEKFAPNRTRTCRDLKKKTGTTVKTQVFTRLKHIKLFSG